MQDGNEQSDDQVMMTCVLMVNGTRDDAATAAGFGTWLRDKG